MKTTSLWIGFLIVLISSKLWAQTDKSVESRVEHVTVFLNKAQVTREIKTRVESGKTNLIVSGLSAQLDQQSVQVSGKGNFVILGISHNQNYLTEVNRPPSLIKLNDSLTYFKQQLRLEQNQSDVLSKEEQMLLSNQRMGGEQQNLTALELKNMADFFRSRLTDIGLARVKLDERISRINEHITKITNQINEQSGWLAQNTGEIVVSIAAEAATSVDLEVSYVVNGAGWYPVYDLRAIDTKRPVQLNYKANVFQQTGETWRNVKLTLSTANPTLGGVKPELYTWYLNFYQPVVYNLYDKELRRKGMVPASAPEMAQEESLAGAATTTAEYVNAVQTSLNTEFRIALPYTINSSQKPTLVEIRNYNMKADYKYSTAPKLDQDAFLIAKAVGWEDFSLLPGEANVFFEGTFVGKTFIDPNNIKDTLSVSLGRDKRIVVKREKLKDFSSRKVIGTNQRDSYAWEISVRNTKSEPVTIVVEDQVPVSQDAAIEVTLTDAGGAVYNAYNGMLKWEITLQPNETKKVVYKFEVKYPKGRQLQGF